MSAIAPIRLMLARNQGRVGFDFATIIFSATNFYTLANGPGLVNVTTDEEAEFRAVLEKD